MNKNFITGFEKQSSIIGKTLKKIKRFSQAITGKDPSLKLAIVKSFRAKEEKNLLKSKKPASGWSDYWSEFLHGKPASEHWKDEAKRESINARESLKR